MVSLLERRGDGRGRRRGRLTSLLLAAVACSLVAVLPAVITGVDRANATQLEVPTNGWSTDGIVWDIARIGGVVYIGGEFTEIRDDQGNVLPRSNLAAFDVATGSPIAWAPEADGAVKALEASADGSLLYVGGNFHRIDGSYRQRMAAIDATSASLDSTFRANSAGRVLELLLIDDQLYIAGEIISINGTNRSRLARVDPTEGTVDQRWAPTVGGGSVRGLAASPDRRRLYVGGTFDAIDGVAGSSHLTAIDLADGAVDFSWDPDMDQPVFDIVATGDDVYLAVAGPGFQNNRLQKHSAIDGSEQLRYLADGDVQDLELRGTTLFVGGHFEKVFGGQPRSQLAAIDITDDHITDFSPRVVTRYGVWKALAGPEGLWLGGEFTAIEGKASRGFGFLPTDELPEVVEKLLFRRDSVWRYDDSGQAPAAGTAWAQPGFDDGNWSTGVGEFGFGDDDEATVVGQTSVLYARANLEVPDPTAYGRYSVRVLADAGAALYVNGVEAGRDNLPLGPLSDSTLAVIGRWTNGERTYTEHRIDPSMLVAGTNTLAVEVHGAYTQPNDMSFNLEVLGVQLPVGATETEVIIAPGSIWSYLDDGSNPDSQWIQVGFDAASWSTGQGQLGFGDGDELTALEPGNISYRFRHVFSYGATAESARIRLLADDGAAVYLNGTEVHRFHLPPDGPVLHSTKATDPVWGEAESTYIDIDLDPALLLSGPNVLAVSVHNTWKDNADLSFDLELTVERPVAAPEPPEEVEPMPDLVVDLVAGDAAWRYLDDGSDPGQSWTHVAFDDAGWSSGVGQFGFGDGDEQTVLSPGATSYAFRNDFVVTGTPKSLSLDLIFDDGAALYLNGVEVARRNLPDGVVGSQTTALASRWGADEASPETITLDPALLVEGQNQLAVSVHNRWSGNADLSFAASLTGVFNPPAGPPPPVGLVTLVALDDRWAYHDLGVDLGTAWRSASFDDAGWQTAAGLLGFGDDDVDGMLQSDAGTYYLRRTFDVVDIGAVPEAATLRLLVDDGAIIYLNDVELVRQNLPDGPVGFDTRPNTVIWGPAERLYAEHPVPADLFEAGSNVIAVEVHNFSIQSSDLAFSLELLSQ